MALRFQAQGKLVRQLTILHLRPKECIFKIKWLGNKDSRSLKCISMNSVHVLRSRVGMYDSKPKYVLVPGSASEGMVWIKEVGMVDSVMIFKSSRSNQEHHVTDFEVLDSKTATALIKISQHSSFKDGHTIPAKSITCSRFFPEELIRDYSYSRGCGTERP